MLNSLRKNLLKVPPCFAKHTHPINHFSVDGENSRRNHNSQPKFHQYYLKESLRDNLVILRFRYLRISPQPKGKSFSILKIAWNKQNLWHDSFHGWKVWIIFPLFKEDKETVDDFAEKCERCLNNKRRFQKHFVHGEFLRAPVTALNGFCFSESWQQNSFTVLEKHSSLFCCLTLFIQKIHF